MNCSSIKLLQASPTKALRRNEQLVQQRGFGTKHYDQRFREARAFKLMNMKRYTPEYGHDALKQGIDSLNYMHRFIDDRHRMVFHPNQPPKQYSKIPGIQKDKNYFTDPYPIYMPCSCNFLITIIKNQIYCKKT